ncbi:MAG: site-specific DNA-methyltransferase [Candidatus Bathyarchaeota archaeon]|nr:site-specific DNA-methyltransferase [Candidatus Bathyarchaeota archaeon]
MENTWHKIIFGNCRDMHEIPDESVHLMVTSPPYYNAPFDYPDLFKSYEEFLDLIRAFARELYRVMASGRIAAFVTDDMLVKGEKYPVVSDITKIMIDAGFRYRDRIVWQKPEGYIRISRRSGVVLQHPYPMYFYPDNIQESIIIFQKGKFDYNYVKNLDSRVKEASKIDLEKYGSEKWYLTVWRITNVLPLENRLEKGIAAFPEEIPRRLIKLYTFVGETVLDPFLGSGTTMKVAKELGRNSFGYEIDIELKNVILKKINYTQTTLTDNSVDRVEMIERTDSKKLRTFLQERVKNQRSVIKKDLLEPILTPNTTKSSNEEVEIVRGNSGWEKLKLALPTVEAVEKRLKYAKERNLSPSYIRTLERLKVYRMKEQIASEAR